MLCVCVHASRRLSLSPWLAFVAGGQVGRQVRQNSSLLSEAEACEKTFASGCVCGTMLCGQLLVPRRNPGSGKACLAKYVVPAKNSARCLHEIKEGDLFFGSRCMLSAPTSGPANRHVPTAYNRLQPTLIQCLNVAQQTPSRVRKNPPCQATLHPLLEEVQRMPASGGMLGAGSGDGGMADPTTSSHNDKNHDSGEAAPLPAAVSFAPPVPYARTVRPAALAVGHFHSVLARGAVWWDGGGGGGWAGDARPSSSRPYSLSARPSQGVSGSIHAVAASGAGGAVDAPSAGGRGLLGLGERAGRGSSVWALARRSGGGAAGGGQESGGSVAGGRKRERWWSNSVGGAGASGSLWAAGGALTSAMNSLDEFHANPRLRFQLLLREQGVVVTLFDAMETVRYPQPCFGILRDLSSLGLGMDSLSPVCLVSARSLHSRSWCPQVRACRDAAVVSSWVCLGRVSCTHTHARIDGGCASCAHTHAGIDGRAKARTTVQARYSTAHEIRNSATVDVLIPHPPDKPPLPTARVHTLFCASSPARVKPSHPRVADLPRAGRYPREEPLVGG